MYRGSAKVLDTIINGTISYEPPVIRVEKVSQKLRLKMVAFGVNKNRA